MLALRGFLIIVMFVRDKCFFGPLRENFNKHPMCVHCPVV